MGHKEPRYLVSFFPSFACLIGSAIQKIPKKIRTFTYGFLLISLILGFYLGFKNIAEEEVNLNVLREGSLYVKNATRANEYVMSESYPYLSYYADRVTIRPPKDKGELYRLLDNYNISYILVDMSEPGNPNYLLTELKTVKFKEMKSFTNQNNRTVTIYKKL